MKMGMNAKEPNVEEFISALAAGNNAQLMVVARATTAGPTTVGLCIMRNVVEFHSSINALGSIGNRVEFVIGEAKTLLLSEYENADLVVIDCNLENHEHIFRAVQLSARRKSTSGTIVLGYNAFGKNSWRWGGSKTQLLPIGEGLLMTRIAAEVESDGSGKRSLWVIKVDKCTGEEHVFRVRSPHGRFVKA